MSANTCEPEKNCESKFFCEPKSLPSGITTEQLLHLRSIVRKHGDMQKARIAFSNRIQNITEGLGMPAGRWGVMAEQSIVKSELPNDDSVNKKSKKVFMGAESFETRAVKEMEEIIANDKVYVEWLGRIKGIGPLTAAKLIAYFEPYWAELDIPLRKKKKDKAGKALIEVQIVSKKLFRPRFRSSLITLCGYGVDDETLRAVCRAGYKEGHNLGNAEYKKTMYVLFECILRQKGKCYDLWKRYDNEVKATYPQFLMKHYGYSTRAEVREAFPNKYIPSTLDLSRRRFIKTFLSILWEKMQEIYGLEVGVPQHCRGVPLKESERIYPEDLCG